ncbi:hypothetical protein [Dietzia kunjamensis]|uniref:hypothetical protein n=1 Tax=Dietzia kunjamensis TaxID=322509 RepID=UPI0039BD3E91
MHTHPFPQLAGSDGTAPGGYVTEGDVLVNSTADGADLNAIYAEYRESLDLYNAERSALVSLLSFTTDRAFDVVHQGALSEGFELASEFGVPKAAGVPVDELRLAYTFEDCDRASRFTWRALRDMSHSQVDSVHRGILEASNRLVTTSILSRLFDPTQGLSPEGNAVYGLFNGDGSFVPPFLGRSWDPATTSHYLTSGSATIDPSDVESLIRMVKLKGHTASGQRLLLLVNPSESETIASFRVGVESADLTRARYDFVPSGTAPARYVTERLEGAPPPEEYGGLPVIGSYGDALVIESMFVPSGYVAMVASGGPNSDRNVVGLREHPNPAYRGLRPIPGNQQRYPLVESFYAQSFGVGVRRRGAAAVMQLTPDATYTAPTGWKW